MVYASAPSIHFGVFTLDLKTGELRKDGLPVKLAPQPSKVLVFLAGRRDQLVTREEIHEHIWSNETFVDFDKGLNFCIKQIRSALGDHAEKPTYIETLPRKGYRFIAPVKQAAVPDSGTAARPDTIRNQPIIAPLLMSPAISSWRFSSWARLLLVAIILIVSAGYAVFYRSRAITPPKRAWVLVSQVENRTGESIFDGTVESALQRELSDSVIGVIPPERVQNALRLMRRDKRTRLDPDIAREVALRDGNTGLVLNGTIEKIGHTYIFSAALMEPASGLVQRSFSQEAADEDSIVPAVHRLALQVRNGISQSELQMSKPGETLEQATTTSLRALQFYSKGIKFINQDKWVEGTEMFRRAVQEDPDFASARIYLAWCYANAGNNKEAVPHFEKAFALADTTSDRERYFILGSYYEARKSDLKRAVEEFEVLTQLYPDDFWGTSNLAGDLVAIGRKADATPYSVRLAELRPDALDLNFGAWQVLSQSGGDPSRAQMFLQRAEALADRSDTSLRYPDLWTQLQFKAADEYLRQGDHFRALQEVERVSKKGDRALGDARWLFKEELATWYVKLGRLHDAERYFRELPDGEQHAELGWLAEIRGDEETLRKELLVQFASGAELGPGTAARLARVGFLSESEKVLAGHTVTEMLRSAPPETHVSLHVQVAMGELAFARGQQQRGLKEMMTAWQALRPDRDEWSMLAASFLSDALSKSGNPLAGIKILEQQLADGPDPKDITAIAGCEAQLRRLYSSTGRQQEARVLQPQIAKQLPLADSDHPLLVNMSAITNYPAQ